jgi:hypothetical protein
MFRFFKSPNESSKISQRWTRINDARLTIIIVLVFSGSLSGISSKWSHFDGSGLWNVTYPYTPSSLNLIRILRILWVFEILSSISMATCWFFKLRQWRHEIAGVDKIQSMHFTPSKYFVLFLLSDLYRTITELTCIILFFGFYLDSTAKRDPNNRTLISWAVDLMADGVVGLVPLFSWIIPLCLSFASFFTLPSVWEEFCKQQSFNKKFSLFQFDSIINSDKEDSDQDETESE